jgi:hypothetical protein
MADLGNLTSTYAPDEAFDVELRGPDGAQLFNDDGSPMTIGILGADSDVAVKEKNKQSNRRLQQGQRLKMTAEGLDSDGASLLAKMTARWNITMGGEKPPFSYETALKLYANPKLAFIREQVDQAAADRSNFLRGSATS